MRPDRGPRRLRWLHVGRPGRRCGPVVLLYHRVARPVADPQLLAVTPDQFADHLALLADRFEPVPLADLVARVQAGRESRDLVTVTLDDGYADNLFAAKPLLERHGVPATVFVASGLVGSGRRFWWDELERLLLRPGRLPSPLTFQIADERLHWELDGDATYTRARAGELAAWTVLDARAPGPRQQVYRDLCSRLRAWDEKEQEHALDHLRRVVAPDEETDGDTPRPLTAEELAFLADGDLVAVGAHTVTHPVLAQLPADRQAEEIHGSKRQLEAALNRSVTSFAYPYGAAGDFDRRTVSLVREAGFSHACANIAGRVRPRTNPFRIPRLLVRGWSADELERRLAAVAA
jgi:peptidoglycan/xylan/chitin deacetylase (PgdA/CDA1 family)